MQLRKGLVGHSLAGYAPRKWTGFIAEIPPGKRSFFWCFSVANKVSRETRLRAAIYRDLLRKLEDDEDLLQPFVY